MNKMEQLHDLSKLKGKTITHVDSNDGLFISFNDGTFIVFTSEYDSSYIDCYDTYDQEPDTRNYDELFTRGFIDQATFDKFKEQYLQKAADAKEKSKQQEIAKLKELKAKYPEI